MDGTARSGPDDLRNALLKRSDQFVETMTEKMMIYALGRRWNPTTCRPSARSSATRARKLQILVHRDGNRHQRRRSRKARSRSAKTRDGREGRPKSIAKGVKMFLTKKYIPRRKFLRGAGATLACLCSTP